MSKNPLLSAKLKNKALLIGYNSRGQSVYTALISVEQYYEGEHPWDEDAKVKELSLKTVHGFLFNDDGALQQEFESNFDLKTGIFESGWQRDEEGRINTI